MNNPSSPMVERVARAIYACDQGSVETPWSRLSPIGRQMLCETAEAAIEASGALEMLAALREGEELYRVGVLFAAPGQIDRATELRRAAIAKAEGAHP